MGKITTMEDDFELVRFPAGQHVSEASGSPKAIEPLVLAMQLVARKNAQKGRIFHADLGVKDASGKDFGNDVIFETFCRALPVEDLPKMDCETCKAFMTNLGDLCILSPDATLIPLVWPVADDVPHFYRKSILDVRRLFKNRPLGRAFTGSHEDPRATYINTLRQIFWADDYSHMKIIIPQTPKDFAAVSESSLISMFEKIIARYDQHTIDRVYEIIHNHELRNTQLYKAPITWLRNAINCIKAQDHLTSAARRKLIGASLANLCSLFLRAATHQGRARNQTTESAFRL
ncbi:hypothetical protein ACMFMF_005975 [Clarireedia jacksonii]